MRSQAPVMIDWWVMMPIMSLPQGMVMTVLREGLVTIPWQGVQVATVPNLTAQWPSMRCHGTPIPKHSRLLIIKRQTVTRAPTHSQESSVWSLMTAR